MRKNNDTMFCGFSFYGRVVLRRKFLAFALSFAILCALVFELYPRSSQEIDLSTGAGISKMLRYENAQVYLFGETHRCTEYQQFRNALFKYLVEKKGVRVLLMEHGYASGFSKMKRYRTGCPLPTNTDTISLSYPKRTMSCSSGCQNSIRIDRIGIRYPLSVSISPIRSGWSMPSAGIC